MMNKISALQMPTIEGTKVQSFVADIVNTLKIKVKVSLFRVFSSQDSTVCWLLKISDTLRLSAVFPAKFTKFYPQKNLLKNLS